MALRFPTSSDFLEAASYAALDGPSGTISFWFLMESSTAANGFGLLGRHDGFSQNGFTFVVDQPSNQLRILMRDAAFNDTDISALGDVNDTSWHHALCTYHRTGGQTNTLYKDGVGTAVATGSTWAFNSQVIRVSNMSDAFWTDSGPRRLCDIAWWDTHLSAGEITALSRGVPAWKIRPFSQVGYWPIRGYLTPEPNSVLTGNDFTLNGSPALTNHAPLAFEQQIWTPNVLTLMAASTSEKRKRRRFDNSWR